MKSDFEQSKVTIPFYHNDRKGYIVVSYGRNEDPVKAGFDTVPALKSDINLSIGYPTMHAVIEAYEGTGYRTMLGWIQIVTDKYYDAYDEESNPVAVEISVDRLNSFQDIEIPYFAFGNLPQAFDAPCLNIDQYAKLTWIADTFLTTVPGRSRDEEISWLLGFRWGYIEYEDQAHKPVVLLPLEVTTEQVWNEYRPFLKEQFPHWNFANATENLQERM